MVTYTAKPSHGAAWVTGASSGIGRSVAVRLATEGFVVYATARNCHELAELSQETNNLAGHIVPLPGDVTDSDDMARAVDTIERQRGALALAVLNAGVYLPVRGEALDVSDFEKTFAVNLSGVVKSLVPAIEAMRRASRGQIAIVASVAGYGGIPTGAAYGASKAGLINMAESLKFDLDKLGIRLQVICPGFVDTPATQGNPFPMPALMKVEDASARIVAGLKTNRFEITFPRHFTWQLKLLQFLPYSVYFAIVNRRTGWSRRPIQAEDDA